LLSPVDKDTVTASNFIDDQRYSLENGSYAFEIILNDNYEAVKKSFTLKENVLINFSVDKLESSSIQPVESFNKTVTPGKLSKSGYDLIPYNVNYYPENLDKIAFYFEAYNTDTVLGKNKSFYFPISSNGKKICKKWRTSWVLKNKALQR